MSRERGFFIIFCGFVGFGLTVSILRPTCLFRGNFGYLVGREMGSIANSSSGLTQAHKEFSLIAHASWVTSFRLPKKYSTVRYQLSNQSSIRLARIDSSFFLVSSYQRKTIQ